MPSQPAVPPLLTPYVTSLSPSSLTVLSSVLDATGNWLVLRFLYAALSAPSNSHVAFGSDGLDGRKKRKVVLGLDLARLTDKGQFAFVDGLSELFYAPSAPQRSPAPPSSPSAIPPRTVLPLRTSPGAVPGRAPQTLLRPSPTVPSTASTENGRTKRLHFSGSGFGALDALENDIANVIEQLKTSKDGDEGEPEALLVIDQPDMLLAATGPNKGIGATEMGEWVMGLQEHAYATILTLSADSPLIHNASTSASQSATPLEIEHAAFAIGSAHRADMVMQLRSLETGAARDVSGVLRISKGGAWGRCEKTGAEADWEEKEMLYFIQRDGGVRIFGRGE
ncbi:hypothetical protein ALT_2083 [Aspergillus lentulus]|uniref:Elongator complex protein 6 n=1 Tax=Aspergillus lentulus TaxID=293939 RepID=A0AAN6BLX9_ASPLE|nr:uncharacterized protein IFM58399_03475 [Aspergillus lentulus]KAF4153973.1 hypothetical protein CNMCM6069_000089 [Aspergillus lentulus]KAF4163047.1 hypothetical protein CNMCM6936_001295 [Aspergillus lentulus]KAF4172723.1 hypothetical protein CNMCM8060_001089 [Aspergillus lentulus]KAF4179824.1 hypothetical protein CNMCM7927_001739 [Aspergillus lentulus]KAF4191829.1 hypothetical protein CNMCM8694_001321 [Aspergillus lentulus]